MDWLLTPQTIIFALLVIMLATYTYFFFRLRSRDDSTIIAHVRTVAWLYAHLFQRLRQVQAAGEPSTDGDVLPSEGPVILVANHRSGTDPVILSVMTGRRVRFLMASEYYETPLLHWLFKALGCIPVRRDGNDLGATKAALKALKAGDAIGVFPQGGIREPGTELDGKGGVVLLAAKTGAPIVPFFIAGSPPCDSVLRAFFTPSRITVYCGAPWYLRNEQGGKLSRQQQESLTQEVLNSIVDLAPREDEKNVVEPRGGSVETKARENV